MSEQFERLYFVRACTLRSASGAKTMHAAGQYYNVPQQDMAELVSSGIANQPPVTPAPTPVVAAATVVIPAALVQPALEPAPSGAQPLQTIAVEQ
jgi:hypothetical protein